MTSKKKSAPAETKALTVTDRAVAALGYNAETVKELSTLAGNSTHIIEITNTAGYDQCHAARMVLKNKRIDLTGRGKDAREDATKFSKAVIAEENRLIAIIKPEEERLQKLQDEFDAAIEAEKQRKIKAEEDRVTALQERIAELRGNQSISYRDTPELITEHLQDLDAIPVDESFEEFQQQASDAKAAGILRLSTIFKDAVQRIADEKRRADEQAELEQLRQDKLARDKADREKREADERAERERLAATRTPVETDRLYGIPHSAGAPRAASPPNTQAPPPPDINSAPPREAVVEVVGGALLTHVGERPSFDEIVRAVAWHFETTEATVREWICETVVMEGGELDARAA